jgi:hypothetical protein
MAGVSNLASVYAPILQGISNGLGVVKFTEREQTKIRELIVELKNIYDKAAKRQA